MSGRYLWKVWAACTLIWLFIAVINVMSGHTFLVVLDLVVAAFQALTAYATYQQYNTGE